MGIIVLAVAILPMLGVGGMQLYRAETPGPVKDAKLTPRITETAKALWYIYLGLTIACALAYWAAGMVGFDALVHSFSTVAIGGFSTHDASIGYFDSPRSRRSRCVFMTIAGINFALHFSAWRSQPLRSYQVDSELKTYLLLLGSVAHWSSCTCACSGTYSSRRCVERRFPDRVDQHHRRASRRRTTSTWPSFLPVLLLFAQLRRRLRRVDRRAG